ncbi:hypothetical protein ACFRFU_53215 [Streptomyces sp. NPDC056704]|uniref:hypothetical protein n=1 Tax=Streptomyces sp. NPDC056704 TaxID=3345917 RepID=UPI0036977E7A
MTVQQSDFIGVTTGDGQRLAALFSVDSDPLRVTTARLAPPTGVPRQQHVRCARPQEKQRVGRVGHLLQTGLAERAPRTQRDAEHALVDLIEP